MVSQRPAWLGLPQTAMMTLWLTSRWRAEPG
jgi:hypothetical protein